MGGIVCAVRGGPDSQQTVEKAIDLAKESGLTLCLVYVVNIDFLDHTTSSRVQTISQEMQEMGEFILISAQAAAKAKGIEAQGVIRHGKVTAEISKLCHEMHADFLVLGRPKFHLEDSLFSEPLLAEFIQHIGEQTGAQVILPEETHP